MERWGVKERVCAVELFIWVGSITETQHRFHCGLNQQETPSANAVCWWVRQWHVECSVMCKKPLGQLSSVCTPENIAWMLASISHSRRWSTIKCTQVIGMSHRSVWHVLHSDLNLHPYKLQIVHSLINQDKEVACNFVISFREYWLKIQTFWTTFWWVMRHIFICMAQLISRTFDTGQLQILTNITNAHFMSQKLSFGVLFGPEESLDPTSLRMKTDNPSQSHLNVT